MKRPLTYTSVVFVLVLLLLQEWNGSLLKKNPAICKGYGEKSLYGYSQDERITICGTVQDYSYTDQYENITTEIILKEIYLLSQNENNSKKKSPKLITKSGQSIKVYMDQMEKVVIGSRVILEGNLSFWKPSTNPGEFDAEKFYLNRDVLFGVKKAELIKVSSTGDTIPQFLKEFRMKQESILKKYLPKKNAAIMQAMLFGNKKEMEEDIKILYQNNGIAHILAISGLHISLIGMTVFRFLQYLPIRREIVLLGSEVFLLSYGCMVGFSASSFRAIFMFTFFLLAKVLKRSYDMVTAMALSAVIQLLIHPGYLYDCGFQLSYGSVIGIGILLPALESLNETIPNRCTKKVMGAFLPSLSVTLITAPILIYHYHELSLFSIVLNFIVLPLMGPLLLNGIVLLMAGNLPDILSIPVEIGLKGFAGLYGIGNGIGWLLSNITVLIVNGILWIFEMGCRLLELLPVGRKNMAAMPISLVVLYYGILIIMTIVVKRKQHVYQFGFIIIGICILFFPKKMEFSIWMLDVGQGDCNVIFTEEGNCFIIDCGSTTKNKVGEKILIPFLKYHGIETVDAVFVTHPDEDHMNGVIELLELGEEETIAVECVVVWEEAAEEIEENKKQLAKIRKKKVQREAGFQTTDVYLSDEWTELMQVSEMNDIPVVGISQGDRISADDLMLECMYPLKGQNRLEGNEASLVLSLEHTSGLRALYTGDLEIKGEKLLVESVNDQKKYDILKVGHHGSKGASSEIFLNFAMPKVAVISVGEINSYGHPHKETLERLEKTGAAVFRTSEFGAMRFWEEQGVVRTQIWK